jgi:hypothetical protein
MESRNQILIGQYEVECEKCGDVMVTLQPGDAFICRCGRTTVKRYDNRIERKENGCGGCGA